MKKRVHVHVSGRVQGVCYRDFTQKWATSFKLEGWVKNLSDGRVEAVIEGEKEKIDEVLLKLKQGPTWANVENLELQWEESTGEFNGFQITW